MGISEQKADDAAAVLEIPEELCPTLLTLYFVGMIARRSCWGGGSELSQSSVQHQICRGLGCTRTALSKGEEKIALIIPSRILIECTFVDVLLHGSYM